MRLLVSFTVWSGAWALNFLLFHLQHVASTSCPKVATATLAVISAFQATGRTNGQRTGSSSLFLLPPSFNETSVK